MESGNISGDVLKLVKVLKMIQSVHTMKKCHQI